MAGPDPDVELVAGRYEMLDKVAGGAMGVIHRARDRETGAVVAVKRLVALHPDARKRFSREVRVLGAVEHPAVVRYLDHGVDHAGTPFLVMQWVDGVTLEDRLRDGPLSVADAVALGRRVASALAEIHRRDIVHRDLKPANLMLPGGDASRATLLDFGVAHVAALSLGMTKAGTLIGTPEFMSPEQSRGQPLSPASDVFSLGTLLYEALTLVSPFASGQVVTTLAKILFSEPEPLASHRPDLPRGLTDTIRRMLAKDPADRPSDGAAVLAALEALALEVPRGDAALGRRQTERPGLTSEERAIVTLVLAARRRAPPEASGAGSRDATIAEPRPWLDALSRRTSELDVELLPLASGGVVGVIERRASPIDQASAACRCALWMQDLAPEFAVVVATGRASVTGALPEGEVLDEASALFERGSEGDIRIDDRTAGLLDPRFEVRADEDGLYLVAERERQEGVRRFLGRETPLVGRRRELRMMELTYAQCVEESSARAMLITSPVGGGKSRLRYELLRRLASSDAPPSVLMAWGDPIRRDSPLALLAGAVRRELGIQEGQAPRLQRARLLERVAAVMSPGERRDHLPFLAELLGSALDDEPKPPLAAARRDAQIMSDRLRAAVVAFLVAASAERPLVLVLDDLHWADAPSVELVAELLRSAERLPLFVLMLGRPEAERRFEEILARAPIDRLALRGLSPKAARRLITAVLGADADPNLVERAVDLADGNAFFLEELIRGMAEGEHELPDSVASMVQARLTALSAETRRVLRAASVFGEVAWASGIAALLGLEEGDRAAFGEALRELSGAEVLTPRAPSRFPDEEEYVFRHALVQQTAYAMLSEEDRALGHRLAADWLESAGERDSMTLAEHWDRGGAPESAAAHLLAASRGALGAHDVEAAARRVARALELARGSALRGALHAIAAEVERWRGYHESAREHAHLGLEALEPGTASWMRVASEGIAADARFGDYDRAEALALSVERAAPADAAAVSEQVCALAVATRQLFHAGRYASAEERLEAAERIAAAASLDPAAEAELHRVRAARARQFGDPAGDADGYAAALDAYERAGDARRACNTRVSLGFALAELGELEAAERHLTTALADAERMGLFAIEARATHNLGMVLAEQGRLDEARDVERAAVEASLEASDLRLEGGSRMYLSLIAWRAGDHAEAEAQAEGAARCFAHMPPAMAGALAARARARLARGATEPAVIDAREAARLLEELGSVEEYEALIHVALLEALGASGADVAEAAARASARLAERAAFIGTPEGRRRFLERDSVNARLAALCADAGVPVEVGP